MLLPANWRKSNLAIFLIVVNEFLVRVGLRFIIFYSWYRRIKRDHYLFKKHPITKKLCFDILRSFSSKKEETKKRSRTFEHLILVS
ncbi:hypothetical protein SAMN02927921_01397 [Sinomicrobium oceani]|uniref:Uncharacterized protein n=1 Tax=Sinomicrobium oceani TaxID=1150368 RepID=A0A1K1NR28_9FLAO|nr:hypothetical protein SAMN02927921_01397 [Sinomicrobium oceani]